MTDPAQIARLAEGLTKAQREALLNAGSAGFGFPSGALRVGGRPTTRDALQRNGIVRNGGILTLLGLAVRAHLTAAQEKSCTCAAVSESGVASRSPRNSTRKDQA